MTHSITTGSTSESESLQAESPELGITEEDTALETTDDICDRVGATDEWSARSLYEIANSAVKISTDKYGNEIENIDYGNRVAAIKELNRMKSESRLTQKKQRKMPFNYILLP